MPDPDADQIDRFNPDFGWSVAYSYLTEAEAELVAGFIRKNPDIDAGALTTSPCHGISLHLSPHGAKELLQLSQLAESLSEELTANLEDVQDWLAFIERNGD